MANSPHAARGEILSLHSEVGEVIKNSLIPKARVDENCFHRWAAAAAVFARSRNFARAAISLLDEGYWEAAAPLIRTLFEDAAVLGYIDAQDERAERIAELYLLSDAAARLRFFRRLKKHNIRSDFETPAAVRQLEANKEKFCALREKLCKDQVEPDGAYRQNPHSWNYLSIADTFRSVGLDMQYDCHYAPLSDLLHSSAYAASYAFQRYLVIGGIDEAQEEQYRLWTERQLVLALGMQLCYAKELVGVTPKGGLPDLEAAMEAVGQQARQGE